MARNREWRKSLSDWRATIDGWVRRHRPEDLLNVDIFFDAVPVHGEFQLAEAAWNYAYERGHAAPDFQNLLIEVARRSERPFTLLGGFRVDERGRMDLKRYGLMPIFTSARVLSTGTDVRRPLDGGSARRVAAKGVGSAEVVHPPRCTRAPFSAPSLPSSSRIRKPEFRFRRALCRRGCLSRRRRN